MTTNFIGKYPFQHFRQKLPKNEVMTSSTATTMTSQPDGRMRDTSSPILKASMVRLFLHLLIRISLFSWRIPFCSGKVLGSPFQPSGMLLLTLPYYSPQPFLTQFFFFFFRDKASGTFATFRHILCAQGDFFEEVPLRTPKTDVAKHFSGQKRTAPERSARSVRSGCRGWDHTPRALPADSHRWLHER